MTVDALTVQNLMAAFPLPSVVIGRDAKIELLNGAAETLLGAGVVGRHFTTALRNPELVEAVERSLQDHDPRTVAYQTVEHGNDTYYKVTVQPVAGTGLLLLSFQDTSEFARAEQMRRDFVANVSHELRTPLTALMGFIETLRSSARDDVTARNRFLGIMATEADRMNRLVAGLLSLSRVEAEAHVRPTARLDLCKVLQTTQRNLERLAHDSNVTLRFTPPDAPMLVMGDADQLLQVFTNLVENVIKYGGAGQAVDMTMQTVAHDPILRGPAIEVTIIDHGPGIEAIHLPRLTERFYRADSHRSRELGGTGLGLAIVKHVLNRYRGRLKIASQLGQGSQFTVVLPPFADKP